MCSRKLLLILVQEGRSAHSSKKLWRLDQPLKKIFKCRFFAGFIFRLLASVVNESCDSNELWWIQQNPGSLEMFRSFHASIKKSLKTWAGLFLFLNHSWSHPVKMLQILHVEKYHGLRISRCFPGLHQLFPKSRNYLFTGLQNSVCLYCAHL